jgi:hypothetical protein
MSFVARSIVGRWANTLLSKFEMFTHNGPTQLTSRAQLFLLLSTAAIAFTIFTAASAPAQTESIIHSYTYHTFTAGGCPPGSNNVYPHTAVLSYNSHIFGTAIEGGPGVKGIPGTAAGTV